MEYIPINFGILRVWQNWLIVALVVIFYVQATRAILPEPETAA